jgi:hypothetical protein
LVHFDRKSGKVERLIPAQLGVEGPSENFFVVAWTGESRVAASVAGVPLAGGPVIWEIDIVSRSSKKSDKRIDEFFPDLPAVFQEARTRAQGGGTMTRPTADGGGTWAAATPPGSGPPSRTFVFVDTGREIKEFEIETTDPTFRNWSVVLVGDWPEP